MGYIAYDQRAEPVLAVITGPRVGITYARTARVLDALFPHAPDIKLISGCAQGVDTHGIKWAKARGVALVLVDIDDDLDGHDPFQAPKNRNQRMVDLKPLICIGFPGHNGTNDMLKRCQDAGVIVWEIAFTDDQGFEVWQWPTPHTPEARLITSGSFIIQP